MGRNEVVTNTYIMLSHIRKRYFIILSILIYIFALIHYRDNELMMLDFDIDML